MIRAGDDGPPPDQVAQIKKLYPGMTDDEIMRLYQRHLAQQQGR